MSSGTSTEAQAASGKPESRGDALQPWQLFTLAGLIGATVVVFVSRGETPAGIVLLSLIVFTAAAVGVAAWRAFAPFARPEDWHMPVILGGRSRAALEREKTLVLRAIKELEFDRAMGKISEPDFAEMSARLRARAARLLRQLDAGATYRQQIEQELAARLGPKADAAATSRTCPSCGTASDADARFCKHCGASLEASE